MSVNSNTLHFYSLAAAHITGQVTANTLGITGDKFVGIRKVRVLIAPTGVNTCTNVAVGVTNSTISLTVPEAEWLAGDYDGEFFQCYIPIGTTASSYVEYEFDFSTDVRGQKWDSVTLFSLDGNNMNAIALVDFIFDDKDDLLADYVKTITAL